MRNWRALGWVLVLAGCGSGARQHRARVLAEAPKVEFIVTRAAIEPVDMPCGHSRFDVKLNEWRELLQQPRASSEGSAERSRFANNLAAVHALLRVEWDDFFAEERRILSSRRSDPRDWPKCVQSISFNRALIELHQIDEAYATALRNHHAQTPPATPAPQPPNYQPVIDRLVKQPQTDQTRYLLGHLHATRGADETARAYFEEIGPQSRYTAEVALRLGRMDQAAGRHAAAIPHFDRAIAAKSERFSLYARYLKARSRFVIGEIEPALKTLLALAIEDERLDAGQTAAYLLASDWDGPPPDADLGQPRAERLLSDPGADRVRRRFVEELVSRSEFGLAVAVADWALALAPLTPEAPGILRARNRAAAQLDPAPEPTDVSAVLAAEWMSANAQQPGAIRAAIALLDETDAQQVQALQAKGDSKGAHARHAVRKARYLDPPVLLDPAPEPPDGDTPEHGFHHATELVKGRHFEAAGAAYQALADAHPTAEWAPKAAFNAAVSYERIGRYASARSLYRQLMKRWPDSELAQPAHMRMAQAALAAFAFDEARQLLGAFAERYPGAEFAPDALLNRGTLETALGISPVNSWGLYLKRYGRTRDSASVHLQLAHAYGEAKQFDQQIAVLDRLLKTKNLPSRQQMRALQAKADALVAQGKPKAARPIWTRLMKGFPEAERSSVAENDIRGRARFELLEPVFERLKAAAAQKRFDPDEARKLIRLYTVLLRRRVPRWAAAALFRQAQIHALWADFAPEKEAKALRNRAIALLRQLLPRTRLFAQEGVHYRPALSGAWAAKARIELCRQGICAPSVYERPAEVPPTRTLPLQSRIDAAYSRTKSETEDALRAGVKALGKQGPDAARVIFEQSAARLVDFAEAELNLALLAEREGKSAAAHYKRAQRTGRLTARVETARVLGRLRAGEPAQSANPHAALRGALLSKPDGTDLLQRATLLLASDPKEPIARMNWAYAAWQAGDWRRALLALQMAEDAEAWCLRARIELSQKKTDAAILWLERAISSADDAPAEAYALRAWIHHVAGEYESAEALNREALARWPGLHAARINLALALRRQGKTTDAIDLLKGMDNNQARINLGLIHLQAGRKDEARQLFEKTLIPKSDNQLQSWVAEAHPPKGG